MKQYSCFQAMYMSFYSRKLYRDVAQNWGGGVVLYLFILLAICWAVLVIKVQPNINTAFVEIVNKLEPQVPVIEIQHGQAKTPENKPYIIKDTDTDDVIGVIDTSGHYTALCITPECTSDKTVAPSSTKILVTKEVVYYLDGPSTIKIQQIPKTLSITIKPTTIKENVIKFVGWTWVLFFPILLLGSFAYRLIQAFFYAIIGKIFAVIGGITLYYTDILKLSMIAVTPAIVLDTIFDWFNINFNFQWLLYFVISMSYLIFALRANKVKE